MYSNSILQTGEREICLFSDKPYLYDIVTGERLAEAKETFHELVGEGDFLIQSVLGTKTGIMVCGEKFTERENGDAEYILIEYDKNLSYIRQFNLAEATGTDFGFWGAALMCASQDGKLLFYPGFNGLYCYNVETQENRELLSEEITVRSIAYLDEQQELFFVAGTMEENADGEYLYACGLINMDTGEIRFLPEKSEMFGTVYKVGDGVIVEAADKYRNEKIAWRYRAGEEGLEEIDLFAEENLEGIKAAETGEIVLQCLTSNGDWKMYIEDADDGNRLGAVAIDQQVFGEFRPYNVLCFADFHVIVLNGYNSDNKCMEVIRIAYGKEGVGDE